MNADYHGSRGVVIIKKSSGITLANPGGFRISIADAKSGGISDPRNTTLIKMFNLINIGERAGSGIPNIYSVWEKQGWGCPDIKETFEPDRITISLGTPFDKTANLQKALINSNDKFKPLIISVDKSKPSINTADKPKRQKEIIIEYLTDNPSASSAMLAELLGLKLTRTREILRGMVNAGIIVSEGQNKNRIYRLKS